MDLISSARRLPGMGETVIGSKFQTAPGGKGANQAVQCARLGADVTMAGCVGDDAFGREMLEMVQVSGVDVSRVKISREHASGVGNVQLEVTGNEVQNRIMVIPGANYALCTEDFWWLAKEVGRYDLVMMQLELPMEITEYVAACAFEAGIPVMLNPAPAAKLSRELLSHITWLAPNEYEAVLLAEHPIRVGENGVNEEDIRKVTEILQSAGVGKLLITLGSNGSVISGTGKKQGVCGSAALAEQEFTYGECVRMPDVKDPTAAGDSFIGAFCTGIAYGFSEKEALAFASHAAAITVCGIGGIPSLPTLDQVQALLRERNCQVLRADRLEELK